MKLSTSVCTSISFNPREGFLGVSTAGAEKVEPRLVSDLVCANLQKLDRKIRFRLMKQIA